MLMVKHSRDLSKAEAQRNDKARQKHTVGRTPYRLLPVCPTAFLLGPKERCIFVSCHFELVACSCEDGFRQAVGSWKLSTPPADLGGWEPHMQNPSRVELVQLRNRRSTHISLSAPLVLGSILHSGITQTGAQRCRARQFCGVALRPVTPVVRVMLGCSP